MSLVTRKYYILGGNNEQFAVYHGVQLSDTCVTCKNENKDTNFAKTVYIYPSEFNVYGFGSSVNMSYKMDENGIWRKDFNIYDHLGNLRVVMRDTNATIPYVLLSQYDYKPFGEKISLLNNRDRRSFIGKEKDWESNLSDFGVRKYEDFSGRFTSIDPLWEMYYGWSPYNYSRNNPISFADYNGLFDIKVFLPNDRSQTGTLYVTDRHGKTVYSMTVLGKGAGGSDRMKENSDTPLGTYDIPDKNFTTNTKSSQYGPHPRLILTGKSGEAKESKRTNIRVHGKGTEKKDGKGNVILQKTWGCLRATNADMKKLNEVLNNLIKNDKEEKGGELEVIEKDKKNDPPPNTSGGKSPPS